MLEAAFLMAGFVVRTATDGPSALRLIQTEIPDVIVLDLMLPWVNGIEVLATVRHQLPLADTPVVVTTGTATSAFDLRSFAPVHVMHKPLDVPTLLAVTHKLLGR